MQTIKTHGYMSFLKKNTIFDPLIFKNAPHDIKHGFYHETNDIAMLVFSSFENVQETIDALIKNIWGSAPPRNETEKTEALSIILFSISRTLSAHSVLVAPNCLLRKAKLIKKNDRTTLVCDLPEKKYIQLIYNFIKVELALCSFKNHLLTEFGKQHLTTFINLLLSKYAGYFVNNHFESSTGRWKLSQRNETTFDFYNSLEDYSFSISREHIHEDHHEDHIFDTSGSLKIGEAPYINNSTRVIAALHSIYSQCFTIVGRSLITSISVVRSMPDWFINTLSDASIMEIKRRDLHLFSIETKPLAGDAPFYEMLVLSMESLHKLLLVVSYLGDLPAPQFAHYQMHFDRCLEHEVSLYISIGKMITFSLYDEYTYSPKILSTKMIQALFIFKKEDLDIDDDISYEKLKEKIKWKEKGSTQQQKQEINNIAREALDKLRETRRRKIAELLFLLFPKILYNHRFAKGNADKEEQLINEKVITSILLHKKSIFIEDSKQVIRVMDQLIDKYKFSDTQKVVTYLKKGKFNNNKMLDEMLREAKRCVIKMIGDVYISFIEPLFLIAWSTYLYSKMQYTSLGDKKHISSNQLHAYISMVGKYDNYFDAIDLGSLAFFLKELKDEEGILDVLCDPFDTKVISTLEETISGFQDYCRLRDDEIDEIIITTGSQHIVQQKRDWICEYLKQASSEERLWFFRFSTNIPFVNPNKIIICVGGSLGLSKSKIIYANACYNNLMVGLSYHIESPSKDRKHYFFENLKEIKQKFPDFNAIQKAKEFFLRDLHESIYSYKAFLTSRLAETTMNTPSGPFIVIKKCMKRQHKPSSER